MNDSTPIKSTDVTVVLPSLNPDEKLINTVNGLLEKGFHDIIVVNDGSDEAHLSPFETISAKEACTLLVHEQNYGKGHALKTAMHYFLSNRPNSPGIITIDGDGQHHADDILACAQAMLDRKDEVILGVRDFSEPEVPFKSRFGNNMTKTVFRLFCGIRISDTQTGLRAIPAKYIEAMTEFAGERFEYETNMLLEMKARSIPFSELKIQTIYLDENASTHFHPIRDSLKIYKIILKFGISSAIASIIELLAFTLVNMLLDFVPGGLKVEVSILIASILSRILSSVCNYKINRALVFNVGSKSSFLRYALLCTAQLLVSASLVSLLTYLFTAGTFGQTVLKAIVDTTLFFLSYRIQKNWVFRTK